MLWLALDIPNLRPVVVVIIYRPPQGDHKRCNLLINEAFERANLKDNTDIFLLGDFNVDFNDKLSPKPKDLDFMTKALGLKQLVNQDTRTSVRNGIVTGTRIDLVFFNSEHIASSTTLDLNISDHLAVMVTRKKGSTVKEKTEFMGRSYRRYIREEFQNNLSALNWVPFYDIYDPNKLWDFMEGEILKQANVFCPIKKLRVNAQREPWITNEAIEAIRDKDRVLRKAKKSGKVEDWVPAGK